MLDRKAEGVAEAVEQRRIEAGAGPERHRLAAKQPAERPLAGPELDPLMAGVAGDAREGGGERRPRPLEHLGEAAVEEDQPAGEPDRAVAGVRLADDAEDRLQPDARRRPADIDDPLEHRPLRAVAATAVDG